MPNHVICFVGADSRNNVAGNDAIHADETPDGSAVGHVGQDDVGVDSNERHVHTTSPMLSPEDSATTPRSGTSARTTSASAPTSAWTTCARRNLAHTS
jgi:hypothetical protein